MPPPSVREVSRWRLLEVGRTSRILRSVDHPRAQVSTHLDISVGAPSRPRRRFGILARCADCWPCLTDPSADVSAGLVDAVSGASHLMRHRGPDEPGTWHDDRRGPRFQPAVDHRHRALPPAAALGPAGLARPLRAGVQRRDLQLPGAAGGTARPTTARRFATDGDGEAIIAAYHYWGTDALTRLRGMFAFALWDTVERELFCARDPFGIKPLFMATGSARHRGRQREEVPARPRRRAGHRRSASTNAPCSTTPCCSTCRSPRRCTAACAGWSPAATRVIRPGERPEVTPVLHARGSPPMPFTAGAEQSPLRRDHRGARGLGGQAHARRRHRRARSCPAASTPPRSPRWPCGTTRG